MTTYYQNPYLPHSLRATTSPPVGKAAQLILDAQGLPMGTAAQVIQWVDDDPDRALRFLVKEQSENRPRVSLVANLKAILKRNDIAPEEVERPAQLAPQIDVIPAERTAAQGGVVPDVEPINQLEMIRERLGVDKP